MGFLAKALAVATLVIEIFAVLILVFGVARCAANIFKAVFLRHKARKRYFTVLNAKVDLGSSVLLGLEILIVADILKSVVEPTITDIFVLGSIVIIRTVISVFLNKEIEALDKEMERDFSDIGWKDMD